MLQDQRLEVIRSHLWTNGSTSVNQLMDVLGVSRETVRRDLIRMAELGVIKKVHGGAVLNKVSEEPPYSFRIEDRYEEKHAIGLAAVALVEAGDTVFIDTGTTTIAFAQLLTEKSIRVVTNSVPIATLLCQRDFDVYLIGGRMRKDELSLSGMFANAMVDDIHVDKAFCGASGIDVIHGIVDYHLEEAELRKKIMERAGKVIILADHTKFTAKAFVTVCTLNSIDTIVTDQQVSAHLVEALAAADVTVLLSPVAVKAEGLQGRSTSDRKRR